jgi:hypothetical protein
MSLLLLLLYVLGSSNLELVHQFSHPYDAAELHSVQQENDPCHIAVYHHLRDGGCSHTSHYVKENKCSLCDIQFHSNTFDEVGAIKLQLTFTKVCTPNSFVISMEGVNYQFKGRAPPLS